MGLEGVIAKRLNSTYKGSRDDSWLKIKCQRRQAFVVGGFALRSGSAKEVGSLLLGVYDDEGRLRYAGSVGTGWDSATGADLLTALLEARSGSNAIRPSVPADKGPMEQTTRWGERWVKPSLVIDVSFTEWTPDGHVRHPSFRGVRKGSALRLCVERTKTPMARAATLDGSRGQKQQAPPERGLCWRGIGYCLRREKPRPARPRPSSASVAGSGTTPPAGDQSAHQIDRCTLRPQNRTN